MNQEQDAITRLLVLLQEINSAAKILVSNQERLMQEQERSAKAIGEAGLLLKNQGMAIVRLWNEAGLPIDDESAPPLTN